MDSNIIEKIEHLLNEEKWTRSAMSSYSTLNFSDLDGIIAQIADDETKASVLTDCETHLEKSKNSVIGLYTSGILTLERNHLDDSNMLQLVSMFKDAEKWNVAEFLCKKILTFGENKSALKELALCYEAEGCEKEKLAVWERIIRADRSEADIVKALAEKYEADGDLTRAVDYYKNAINRYFNRRLFANVKELWGKLIEIIPDDIDFFENFIKKAGRSKDTDKLTALMQILYQHFKKTNNWDKAIETVKKLIENGVKDADVRKEIIECFTAKYGTHKNFKEYLENSNLEASWRPLEEAIADFEKQIAFTAGNFVFHKTWGIGRIAGRGDDSVIVDFVQKKKHSMSTKMAVSSLDILPDSHIWVIKCTHKKQDLRDMFNKDVAGTLKTVIKSFGNCVDLKKIKAELSTVFTPSEWQSWVQRAKEVLKSDSMFGNIPDKEGFYEVRSKEIKFADKALNRFKSESGFFDKLQTFREFCKDIAADESNDDSPEAKKEMLDYFGSFLNITGNADEKVIASYLLLNEIGERPAVNFRDLFAHIADIEATFKAMPEKSELKGLFLETVKANIENWPDIFCRLFPSYLNDYIPHTLIGAGMADKVEALFSKILADYKDNRATFIWIINNGASYDFYSKIKPSEESILVDMLHILGIVNRNIERKKNAVHNKKIANSICGYVFKGGHLDKYMFRDGANERENKEIKDNALRMYYFLENIPLLEAGIFSGIKNKLQEKYPDFKSIIEKPIETVKKGIMVTRAAMERKQAEKNHIETVEIPKNSKDIGAAIALGDLSENAEYKYGKEMQERLNIQLGRLKKEIGDAVVFDAKDLNLVKISFGTKAQLLNVDTDETVTYTILGPWESNPDANIISYLSPLGESLCGFEVNDTIKFEINSKEYNYKVLKIEKSDLV